MSSFTDFNSSNGGVGTDSGRVRITGTIGGTDGFKQTTCKEVTTTESLLTPGLQTSATFQSQIYKNTPFKNWDATKNQIMFINMEDDFDNRMKVAQTVYRLDNREFMPVNIGQTEEMTFHACDVSLLKDAKTLVSKSWKCTTPDEIVRYVLESCIGASNPDIQNCSPARDYIAEMIHPFQVIQQQANLALDGDDPSFIHYMTYGNENNGWEAKHHFRSLKSLASQGSKYTYYHSEVGYRENMGYNDRGSRRAAIHFTFPCDYDLLSDLLNGLDENGNNINAGSFLNPSDATGSFLGGTMSGCIQNGNHKQSLTNKGTAQQQNGCETDVEKHLLRRQARMGLLEKDKVALRLIAPWNPLLHAGDVITLEWKDKDAGGTQLYGSGDYLIASMTHRVQMGGYSTTTLDCVSTTVGRGIV
jgi:hypothetical protein